MKIRLIQIIIIVTALCFHSCNQKLVEPFLENKILGNWIVIDSNGNPVVTEWGLYYVSSVKLYRDNSFKVNIGTGTDSNTSKSGTWELENKGDAVVFYSVVNNFGKTTKFNISFESDEILVFKNNLNTIRHKKLNN
jgi:hypothetical protein